LNGGKPRLKIVRPHLKQIGPIAKSLTKRGEPKAPNAIMVL
jgi:hypothetical protein